MARRIYSRRITEMSWVGAGEHKPKKPPEPLRYRIAPWEKKLDLLDKQEAELVAQWDAKQIDWEEYEEYLAVIEGQRDAIDTRRRKATGQYVKPAREPVERPERVQTIKVKAEYRLGSYLTPLQVKAGLLIAVILIYLLHSA